MKTLFCGWPIMVHDTHTRRRRSEQQLIFLKFKTKIKSESNRKWVCKSDWFGCVKKWRNPSD